MVPEEQINHVYNWTGEAEQDLIRSDMTLFETAQGGAVFSTGSITFCGSLPYNKITHNISQLLKNVLNRFLQQGRTAPSSTQPVQS